MTNDQCKTLAADIIEARKIGQAAADAVDDGGTCNMDTVCLRFNRVQMSKLEAAGIKAYRLRSYVALSASFGQANKNTAGVRAMSVELVRRGYQAHVWYQMD